MASLPSRGASVFQNIQNGGRQTVNSVSKPTLHATLAAKVSCNSHACTLKCCSATQHPLVPNACIWPYRQLGGADVFIGMSAQAFLSRNAQSGRTFAL